jgi:uncharacterized protein
VSEVLVSLGWIALGAGIGAYGTLIGAGGGFILVPVLLLLYPHRSPEQLTAVSLAVVFANAASGSFSYFRLRRIDYATGIVLALATIPGAVIGAILVGSIPRQAFNVIMGLALILVAVYLLFRPQRSRPLWLNSRFVVSRSLTDSEGTTYRYRLNLLLAAVLSLGVGLLSSLLGIGGGIIHVPLLTTFFGFPAHIATATSQFTLMITAATATITHAVHGDYQSFVRVTVELAIGAIIGAPVGAGISRRVKGSSIIRLLALALGVVGIRLLLPGL